MAWKISILAILVATSTPFTILAQEKPAKPTDFAADTVTFFETENRVTLENNASIVSEDFNVEADQIEVFLLVDAEGQRSVDHLVATGRVKATIQGAITTADDAEYDAQSRTALFTGNVETNRNGSIVRGEKLEADINTGIYRVIGGVNGKISGSL